MKRLLPLISLALCALLLLFSKTALNAAQQATSMWLTKVLPALFPFYVAVTILSGSGIYEFITKHFPWAALPACLLLGGISGYPAGARLCALSGRSEWSVYCNLCSPAFLLGVVAIGMLRNTALFAPLALAHYGAAALTAIIRHLLRADAAVSPKRTAAAAVSLPQIIGDGMLAMLKVGGCIIFFSVLSALIAQALSIHDNLWGALLAGTLEMTAGCQSLASLPLPPRMLCACMAAVISFGGLSVYMQAKSVAADIRPFPYLMGKLFQACLACLMAYIITPWFYEEGSEVISAQAETLLGNASALAVVVLATSLGLVFAYLFALVIKKARRRVGAGL